MACPICFENYQKDLVFPVRLKCNHIVCLDCLKVYQINDSVKCPVCLQLNSEVAQLIRNNRPDLFFQMFESVNKSFRNDDCIKVFIKTSNGDNFFIHLRPEEKIKFIKQVLFRNNGVGVESQLILFNGFVLKDEQSLDQAGVKNGDILFLVSWIRNRRRVLMNKSNFYINQDSNL